MYSVSVTFETDQGPTMKGWQADFGLWVAIYEPLIYDNDKISLHRIYRGNQLLLMGVRRQFEKKDGKIYD